MAGLAPAGSPGSLWRLGHGLSYETEAGIIPDGMVVRTKEKGQQTILGAVRSSLLGAALAIQQAVCRAAINTPIQMTGGNLTKILSAEIWQATRCPSLNIHDEIIWAEHVNLDMTTIREQVYRFEDQWRQVVRHIKFDLKPTERWSDK